MRSRLILSNAVVAFDAGLELVDVIIENGKIETIISADAGEWLDIAGSRDENDILVDLHGRFLNAGYIDLQINGAFGHEFIAEPESIWEVGEKLLGHGVTSFLPTIISSPPEVVERAKQALRDRPMGYVGAEPLGLHLEGPMLSPMLRGGHRADLLRMPSMDVIEGWNVEDGVMMVTVAPELPGVIEVIEALASRGVVVSLGHSEATAEQAAAAVEAGATHVTHLYHRMSQFSNRNPGMVGFALGSDSVTCGLIVDNVISNPLALRMAWRAKGPNRLTLVSDALPPTGLPDGPFEIAGQPVLSRHGVVSSAGGRVLGSSMSLPDAVRRMADITGCELYEAARSASLIPAQVLGIGSKGRVHLGAEADLVVLDDNGQPVMTIVDGRVVYDSLDLVARSVEVSVLPRMPAEFRRRLVDRSDIGVS